MRTEARTARIGDRHPWLTYGLLLICVAVLGYDAHLERLAEVAHDKAVVESVEYWWERPYLDASDLPVESSTAQAIATHRDRYQRERDERGAPRIAPAMKRRHQQILDGLQENALEPLRQLPRFRWGVQPRHLEASSYLTHGFIHSGWLHLIGNGFLLLILGFYLERTWGRALFVLTFLATSFGAATAFVFGNPDLTAPMIGTSGVIAGLLAAFGVRFREMWRDTTYPFVLLTGVCWLVLPSWFGWEMSVARDPSYTSPVAGVASPSYWALAGGFGCGLLLAVGIVVGKVEAALRGGAAGSRGAREVDRDLHAALDAHAEGRIEEAFERIAELLARRPDDCDALIAMWDVAIDLGRPLDASNAMLRVIREEVRNNSPTAIEHWRELSDLGLHSDAEPTLLIRIAALLREADQPNAALDALTQALDAADDWDVTVVATRVARASRDIDPVTSERAAWRALGCPDLAIEERQDLESLLADLQQEPGVAEARIARSLETRATPRRPVPTDPEICDSEPNSPPQSPRPAPIDLDVVSRQVQIVEAVPSELHPAGIVIEADGGIKKRIPYERVDGVSAVAIEGLGEGAVVVVDLTLNWFESDQALRLIRMRGNRFDPRALLDSDRAPLDAMREFIERLLQKTSANPLPDLRSARGLPFASFQDLASYERDVLSVERAPLES